jgi:hypothetical protein
VAATIQDWTTKRVIFPLYCPPSLFMANPAAIAESLLASSKLVHTTLEHQVERDLNFWVELSIQKLSAVLFDKFYHSGKVKTKYLCFLYSSKHVDLSMTTAGVWFGVIWGSIASQNQGLLWTVHFFEGVDVLFIIFS